MKTLGVATAVFVSLGVAFAAPPQSRLTVTPSTGAAITGTQGGPFAPTTFSYSLSASNKAIGYSVTGLPPWLTPSRVTGVTPATITFALNRAVMALQPGSYAATIAFANTTNGAGNTTRAVALTVNAIVQPPTNYLLCGAGYCLTPTGDRLTVGAFQGSKTQSVGPLNFVFVRMRGRRWRMIAIDMFRFASYL